MSDKLLLTLPIDEFRAVGKRPPESRSGMLDSLWKDFSDHALVCFHCGEEVEFPAGKTDITPAPDNLQIVLCIPLCADCGRAPPSEQWEKTKALIETMYSQNDGKWRIEPARRSLKRQRVPPSTIPVGASRWHRHDHAYRPRQVKARV